MLDRVSIPRYSTLVDLLRQQAQERPNQSVTFLTEGEKEEECWTFQKLEERARTIGAWLQDKNATGKCVLLLYPPGLDYIAGYFGCQYAGAIAVPAYPPRPRRVDVRLQTIAADTEASLALTTQTVLTNPERAVDWGLTGLQWQTTDTLPQEWASAWHPPSITGHSISFLQFTSGSTSAPKGAMVTHGNLLHNLGLIQRCFEPTPESCNVIWLPPYHDMGLIGGILTPLYVGYRLVLMSPVAFIQHPLRWLQAISRFRASISGGPNFAYDLCVRKITDEQRADLNLSSWRVAFNGAEPVREETLNRFSKAFMPYGFRPEAFCPCYGLAEATLLVSGCSPSIPPTIRKVNRATLKAGQVELSEAPLAQSLVGCGPIIGDQVIVIADAETLQPCPTGQVGEICISGPSVVAGYWKQPDVTQYTFHVTFDTHPGRTFLRTGDLGFMLDGELFITGRIKDLIIIDGRNHYPEDIERTVEKSHPALRPSSSAVFSVDMNGREQPVVVAEVERNYRFEAVPLSGDGQPDYTPIIHAIRQAVSLEHGLSVPTVMLLKPGSIPKTSSGKIQRHACRNEFLAGTLEAWGISQN